MSGPQLKPFEEVKFIGSYDLSKGTIKKIPGFLGGNGGYTAEINGLCGFNHLSINGVISGSDITKTFFADETYSLVSYNKVLDNKYTTNDILGLIIWSGTYFESLSDIGITPPSVQQFVVTGSSGIYKDVKRVVIDFANNIRVIYFIGNKFD